MAVYSDLDISFVKDPVSRDIPVLTEEEAVKQSVMNLLYTNFYERPFQPALGNSIMLRLFEPYDDITEFVLANDIRNVIRQFEPRATVKFVDVYKNRGPENQLLDEHALLIEVGFIVQNIPQIQTTRLVLKRVR